METAIEQNVNIPQREITPRLWTKVVQRLDVEGILFSILASITVIFVNVSIGTLLLFFYLMVTAWRGKISVSWLSTFLVFQSMGFFAAHQYDLHKAPYWFLFSILPVFLSGLVLPLGSINFSFVESTMKWVCKKIPIHWGFSAFVIGELVALFIRDMYSYYGGALVILLLLTLFARKTTWRAIVFGLLMMLGYTFSINLILWKGLLLIKREYMEYLQMYWNSLVTPLIIVIIHVVNVRGIEIVNQPVLKENESGEINALGNN